MLNALNAVGATIELAFHILPFISVILHPICILYKKNIVTSTKDFEQAVQ